MKMAFFKATNCQIERILKFLGENVVTRLLVGESNQIIKLSSFMSHFYFRFSPHLLHYKFEKNPGLGVFHTPQG
jgi:hypothetical protein